MKRIAGLDFGTVRIGLALSDLSQFLATPNQIILAKKNLNATAQTIAEELAKHGPLETIVLGLPLHMDGKESPLSTQVRLLAPLLEKLTNTPVVLWDERLSTAQVERTLKEANMNRKKRASIIDATVAAAILQNYLDSP